MRKHLLLSLILMLTYLSVQIFAGSTGKISGTVTDKETGEPLPFANVFVDGTTLGAASDLDGNFTILNVPPGVYSITASVIGYQKVTITETRVNVDFTTRIDFELSSGTITMEAVIVQGERNPLIRQDLTNPTTAITAETIMELPIDQISDVIKLQAGVTVGDDGDIHIRGGFGNETSYTLNGVSIIDPYNNRKSVGLATNAVQEVSVSSGTFSAEYGNALSGIVNYVTKSGGPKYSFSLRGYAGEYFTDRTELYPNISDVDPLNRARVEGTFGGPVISNKVKIFLSGIYENYKGLYNGQRLYNTTDSYLSREAFSVDDPRAGTSSDPYWFNPYGSDSINSNTGDDAWVSMNPSTNLNLQGNLLFNITSLIRLKYEVVYDKGEWQSYNRLWKFNPDGRGTNYDEGLIQSLDFTHTVSENLFYTLQASFGYHQYKFNLYDEVDDTRYLHSLYQLGISNTSFVAGGTSLLRQNRNTATTTFKGDLVTQLGKHEFKVGFETRLHTLDYESYNVEILKLNPDGTESNVTNDDLLYDDDLTLVRQKPDALSLLTEYSKEPVEASIYILDKMELADRFILNLGLRYEYFDPKAPYNTDLSSDLENLQSGVMYKSLADSEPKHQLSPRLSVSYPITAESVIRFSYGHFYQHGNLSSLYRNPKFFVANVGSTPTFGNANVNMQRSIQYEMGLQQQFTENLKMELTGYYKDVRDYIYTQTVFTNSGREYRVLTNLAYSNVRGITFRLERRRNPFDIFYGTLDYTFQIADGNRTEPEEDLFYSDAAGKQTETYLVPLDFDRRHVLNITVGLFQQSDWAIGLIYNLQTGSPYTPEFPPEVVPITFEQNSGNQIIQNNLNLKFEKYFKSGSFEYSVFLQIDNIMDFQNELSVYLSTGKALTTIDETVNPDEFNNITDRIERGDPGLFGVNQIDNYYSGRPERVSRPREIRLGFTVVFN